MPQTREVLVEGGVLIDSNAIVAPCANTQLWSDTDDGPSWVPYALNSQMVDSEGRSRDGADVICAEGEVPGPFTFELPLDEMVDGWYRVCTMNGCRPSFEHRRYADPDPS